VGSQTIAFVIYCTCSSYSFQSSTYPLLLCGHFRNSILYHSTFDKLLSTRQLGAYSHKKLWNENCLLDVKEFYGYMIQWEKLPARSSDNSIKDNQTSIF